MALQIAFRFTSSAKCFKAYYMLAACRRWHRSVFAAVSGCFGVELAGGL